MSSTDLTDTSSEVREVRLRGGHVVEIVSRDDGTVLRVRGAAGGGAGAGAQGGVDASAGAGAGVEILIDWSPQGPVVRVRAARIDLETTSDVNVRCNSFQVEAAQGISLRAQGDLTASAAAVALEARNGDVVARANDDVQLLGEQILLNCDRAAEMPDWVKHAPGPTLIDNQLLAVTEASGDSDLIATVRDQKPAAAEASTAESKDRAPR